VAVHCGLEGLADGSHPLAIPEGPAHDEARVVVEDDQGVDLLLVDVAVKEIQVPQMVRPYGFVALIVPGLAPDLGGHVPVLVQNTAHGVQADLEALPAQLVAHLAGAEAGVGPPLLQDPAVPGCGGVLVAAGDRAVGHLALGVQSGTPPPLVDGEAGDPQLRGGGRQALGGGELQSPGALRGCVDPGH